jgi:hypothetical protein
MEKVFQQYLQGPIIYSGNELSNNGSNDIFLKSAGIFAPLILGHTI